MSDSVEVVELTCSRNMPIKQCST